METISQSLFWVSNSLLIPDIIILLVLFFRSLILIGSFYNQFTTKRKNDQALSLLINHFNSSNIDQLKDALPKQNNALVVKYLRRILESKRDEAYTHFLISSFENDAEKDISLSKLLAKMGPVLGLIGALIAMSPALVGLSTGDIAGMAYNMQVVFATTVVGLVISAIGLVTLQFKQSWYAKDINNLDFVARIINSNPMTYETSKEI